MDKTPPSLACPANQVIECVAGGAQSTFQPILADNCPGGTASCLLPSGSVFPLGTSVNQCDAIDGSGNRAACAFTVQVQDTQKPTVTVDGRGLELWPPNHKYVEVSLSDCIAQAVDGCAGPLDVNSAGHIVRVTSDEVEDDKLNKGGDGDGNTCNDIVITGNHTVRLLAERMGGGNGRVYRVFFEVADPNGNVAEGSCKVAVPHDQGGRASAVEEPCSYCVGAGCGNCAGHALTCTY